MNKNIHISIFENRVGHILEFPGIEYSRVSRNKCDVIRVSSHSALAYTQILRLFTQRLRYMHIYCVLYPL